MPAGTVVASGSLVSPGGQQGIPGPNAVSTDAGNQATFGSDNRIYVPDPTPKITSVQLRTFNAVGNPTFECDQISCGTTLTNVTNKKVVDRWIVQKTGATMTFSAGQQAAGATDGILPGTNFKLSSAFFRVTLTAAQATLAAGDICILLSNIEGTQWRELSSDVHSIWLLVRSSVAGLKFGLALVDTGYAWSLTKLCTITSANTWTAIALPNLPLWASGGAWGTTPGALGYVLYLTLASGSSYLAPANDVWQSGYYLGAVGQSNFGASPVNSTFDIAYISHVPGANCFQIDKPFLQNYDECLRYYCSNYPYGTQVGTANQWQQIGQSMNATTGRLIPLFPRPMAKTPTCVAYGVGGGINTLFFDGAPAVGDMGGCSIYPNGTAGLQSASFTGLAAAAQGWQILGNWTADSGW